MTRTTITLASLGVAVFVWACGGGEGGAGSADTTARDLTLAPAESIAPLDDRPQAGGAQPAPQRTAPTSGGTRTTTPSRPPAQPTYATLAAGTALELTAADSISSRTNKAGDPVTARVAADVKDERGRVVIPAGATVYGTVEEIKPAGSPGGQGTLVLAFNQVRFGGRTYSMDARSDTLGTEMKGEGVTGGDAAKVGVGAAAGAIAGRVIGGDTKGAVIGGVVGAAAGAGIAVATKDQHIILPAGGRIRLVLGTPMTLAPVS